MHNFFNFLIILSGIQNSTSKDTQERALTVFKDYDKLEEGNNFQNFNNNSTSNSTNLTDTLPVKFSIWTTEFQLPEILPNNVDFESQSQRLSVIYAMANGFVYLVLRPFEGVEKLMNEILVRPNNTWNYFIPFINDTEGLGYDQDNEGYLPTKLYIIYKFANFEIGYIVCLTIGVAFCVATPIVGVCFCSCRLCDHRCSGLKMAKK